MTIDRVLVGASVADLDSFADQRERWTLIGCDLRGLTTDQPCRTVTLMDCVVASFWDSTFESSAAIRCLLWNGTSLAPLDGGVGASELSATLAIFDAPAHAQGALLARVAKEPSAAGTLRAIGSLEWDVRARALRLLATLQPRTPALALAATYALGDAHSIPRQAARAALGALGITADLDGIAAGVLTATPRQALRALRALAETTQLDLAPTLSANVVDVLQQLVASPVDRIAAAALRAAFALDHPAGSELVARALSNLERPETVAEALRASPMLSPEKRPSVATIAPLIASTFDRSDVIFALSQAPDLTTGWIEQQNGLSAEQRAQLLRNVASR